jgi:hypothetical protein
MALHSSAANADNTAHLITASLRCWLNDTAEAGWISAGNGEEWVMIDLGFEARLSKAIIRWGADFALRFGLQGSSDGERWMTLKEAAGDANAETVSLLGGAQARYVRILCEQASGERYHIHSAEIWGAPAPAAGFTNSLHKESHATLDTDGLPDRWVAGDQDALCLTQNWCVERASEVAASGKTLSLPGCDGMDWLPAVVPGTVLSSFLAAGAVPDPNYDDWQFQVSDAFFTADFWYRTRFELPESRAGQRVYLQFDAVNWKADVYLNGQHLPNSVNGRAKSIEGAFIRGSFDVTASVYFGSENYLAVRIYQNETPGEVTTQGLAEGPGPNGGELGADNPTLHASVGWDWLPTIRGRNTGIYGDVSLRFGGGVRLLDPWIQPDLDLTEASAQIAAEDLGKRPGVTVTDGAAVILGCNDSQWIGADQDGVGFTLDLVTETTVGAVTLLWGTEAGGAAADLESRHPSRFRLERSRDGVRWENFDAYPGGAVDMEWFGRRDAEPSAGTGFFEGHAISDSLQGGTAYVPVDMTAWGMGNKDVPVFAPQQARYLRFTATERRQLNGRPVPVRVQEIRVYAESPVQVEQSLTRSYFLDGTKAELTFRTDVRNDGAVPVTAVINGVIHPPTADSCGDGVTCNAQDHNEFSNAGVSDLRTVAASHPETADAGIAPLTFSKQIELLPGEVKSVVIDGIMLENPQLWWPNTYGAQPLYTCEAAVTAECGVTDAQVFKFGVRRLDYPVDGGLLTLYCNGVRIVAKGGNWGMDDGLKRDTPLIYDHKVRLHREANMTMIRNWVGMTHHPAFYDACDKYGILIWDDFWLANPVDGPDPTDPALFLENAADKISRNRHHAALALYCGRNEGNPPPALDEGLQTLVRTLDGTRLYFPNSASAPVGSGGGYSLAWPGGVRGVKQYFNDVTSPVLRSERGIPNVPELASLRRFVSKDRLWPISEVWALHDWTYHMNGPASSYMAALQGYLGGSFTIPEDKVQGQTPDPGDPVFAAYKTAVYEMIAAAAQVWTVENFSRAAQLINYEHHRGLFDALVARRSNGLLIWMSQSSWPSFMWQTYDWYLDTNGGYFGAKAGNQPTRAIWDPRDDSIFLANATGKTYHSVTTEIAVYNLQGELKASRSVKTPVLGADTCGFDIAKADFSASDTELVFLRLRLVGEAGTLLGENTYWHNHRAYQDYRALNSLGPASVTVTVSGSSIHADPHNSHYQLTLENTGTLPAVQAVLKAFDNGGGVILPVFFSDNYITLMPGDRKTVTAEVPGNRTARFSLEGWNTHRVDAQA